jgi:hypothetical protein
MRATARLHTSTVRIECPFCHRAVQKPDGGTEFSHAEIVAGEHLVCDKDDCKEAFRIPTSMKASIGGATFGGAAQQAAATA